MYRCYNYADMFDSDKDLIIIVSKLENNNQCFVSDNSSSTYPTDSFEESDISEKETEAYLFKEFSIKINLEDEQF